MMKLLLVFWRNLFLYALSINPPRLETYWIPRLLIMKTLGFAKTVNFLAKNRVKVRDFIKVGEVFFFVHRDMTNAEAVEETLKGRKKQIHRSLAVFC